MITDLQKAGLWKRISAGLLDAIALGMLAVGIATLLSVLLGYTSHMDNLNAAYDRYEKEYGVEFQITQAQYDALTAEEQAQYDRGYQALIADEEVVYTYNILINQTMLITTFGILVSVVLLEFVVPLLLKNGQTLGKKVFGIALMRSDGVKMNNLQLFARTVLGKFTIELMIPIYIIIMIFFNSIGIVGLVVLAALAVGQIISLAATKNGSLLHDVLAGTVAVDLASQMIFPSKEAQIEYVKRLHAQEAKEQKY